MKSYTADRTPVKRNTQASSSALGTNAIPRNRRGPMSRRSGRSSNATSSRSPGFLHDAQYQQHQHYSSPQPSRHLYQPLSTHMDQDDREILIESALGTSLDHHFNNEKQRHMKSRKSHGQYYTNSTNSGITNTATRRSLTSPNKRSYSPLKGRDIFTEEEMKNLTHLRPDSIFDIPPIIQKNRRVIVRTLFVLIGMLFYFVVVTISHHKRQHENTAIRGRSNPQKTGESNVGITQVTYDTVFKDNTGRSKAINSSREKAMDMFSRNGEDDMVNLEALQAVKANKIYKAVEKKKTNIGSGNLSVDIGTDLKKKVFNGNKVNEKSLNDNTANHAYIAQVESNTKLQQYPGFIPEKSIIIHTSKMPNVNVQSNNSNRKGELPKPSLPSDQTATASSSKNRSQKNKELPKSGISSPSNQTTTELLSNNNSSQLNKELPKAALPAPSNQTTTESLSNNNNNNSGQLNNGLPKAALPSPSNQITTESFSNNNS